MELNLIKVCVSSTKQNLNPTKGICGHHIVK